MTGGVPALMIGVDDVVVLHGFQDAFVFICHRNVECHLSVVVGIAFESCFRAFLGIMQSGSELYRSAYSIAYGKQTMANLF